MRAPDSPEGRAAGRAADRPTGPPEASPEARPAAAGSRGAAGPPEAGPPERDGPPQSSSQPAAQACDSGPCEGPGRGPPEGVPQAQEAHALLGRAVRTSDAEQDAPGARPAAGGGRRPGGPGAGRGAPVAGGGGAEGRGPGAPDGRHAEAVAEGSDLFLALGEAGRLDFSKDRELVEHARDVLASLSGDAEDGCGPAAREPSEPALGSTAAGSEVQPGLEVPPAGPADDSAPAQAPRRSACGLAQAFGASPRSECRSSFSSGGVSPTACPHPAGVGLRERLAAQKRRSDGEALDACSLTSRSTVSSVCAGDPIGSAAAPLPRQSLSSPHGRGALLGEDAAEEGAPAWASPKRTGPRRSQSPGSPWTSQVQSEEDMADDALDDFDSLMLEGGRPSCAQECCIRGGGGNICGAVSQPPVCSATQRRSFAFPGQAMRAAPREPALHSRAPSPGVRATAPRRPSSALHAPRQSTEGRRRRPRSCPPHRRACLERFVLYPYIYSCRRK
ncbi:unnamed protein product [Prorocentrum cordatum]|uniref:Uncharacterized protein n=1 Tax=Prorocentrum cordatum TaxID=2364126 RepID=A0ABN9VJN9_9DINO|nr:unnamed protein product [Polarella glacialis]